MSREKPENREQNLRFRGCNGLTDQSGSFYSWSFEPTLFQKYLDDMKIEHIVSDPHSPQTQGKVERLTQTIQKELLQKLRFKSYEHAQQAIEGSLLCLNNRELLETTWYSKSILYEWSKDIQERQPRAVKCIDEAVAVNAIKLIIEYPHLGGALQSIAVS